MKNLKNFNKNVVAFFKKPIPALAFGSTSILAILKLVGLLSATWLTVLIPLLSLVAIWTGLTIGVLITASIMAVKRIKDKKNESK